MSVFEGNSGDPKTLLPQVDKMREQFGFRNFVQFGDRGMITQKQVDELREIDRVDWLSALRPGAVRKLIEGGWIQMGLFDERNLFELEHPDWPDERLIIHCGRHQLEHRLPTCPSEAAQQLAMVQKVRPQHLRDHKDPLGVSHLLEHVLGQQRRRRRRPLRRTRRAQLPRLARESEQVLFRAVRAPDPPGFFSNPDPAG